MIRMDFISEVYLLVRILAAPVPKMSEGGREKRLKDIVQEGTVELYELWEEIGEDERTALLE